jgi:hypothetical protein
MGKTFTFDVVSDISSAQQLWSEFVDQSVLWNNWNYRNCFHYVNPAQLRFYIVKHNGITVAFLPLEIDQTSSELQFFGGHYQCDNRFYFKPGYEEAAQALLENITFPLNLRWMSHALPGVSGCVENGSKYVLDLRGVHSVDEYYQKFWSAKRRKKLLRQFKHIEDHTIETIENNYQDIDLLVEFNKIRFREKSSFHKPQREEFMKSLLDHFEVQMMTTLFDGVKQAVWMGIYYNNVFYGINSGRNIGINNLGKYMILQRIRKAIELGARAYDAKKGNYGWKEAFGFSSIPQYVYDTRIEPEVQTEQSQSDSFPQLQHKETTAPLSG